VERLHVELLLALQLDKPHRRTRRRFGDPFLMWLLCVCVLSLRALMSSIMRWRSGLMASLLMGNSPE
jgi:hypothetical protein